jgi:hypothetical protein
MDEYQTKLAKPHCKDCSKTKVGKHFVRMRDINRHMAEEKAKNLRDRMESLTSRDEDI